SSIACSRRLVISGRGRARFRPRFPRPVPRRFKETVMKRILFGMALSFGLAWSSATIAGFCGFYVGKADTKLFNRASQVVLVRDGDRTVMTMASDFEGAIEEFAIVVPVPTFLKREQIHVGDKALVDHLDAYSAPRLVEYFDQDPCATRRDYALPMAAAAESPAGGRGGGMSRAKSLGGTIEAQYTVGD